MRPLSEMIKLSSSLMMKIVCCWLIASPAQAEIGMDIHLSSVMSESAGPIISAEQKVETKETKRDESMSPWKAAAVFEVIAAGYGYWAAEDARSYVGVSRLMSVICGASYIADKKPEYLNVSLIFGVMAKRRMDIDSESTPKREIAKSTFIDFNILMGLSLLVNHFLPDSDKNKTNQKISLGYIPRAGGGVMMISRYF